MLNAQYFPLASSATDAFVAIARRNVELFEEFASTAKDTPVAPLFDLASKAQHSLLNGFETFTGTFAGAGAGAAAAPKTAAKPAAKKAAAKPAAKKAAAKKPAAKKPAARKPAATKRKAAAK